MKVKLLELALQGGGSHGAFTWGVIDRLLEDERIKIEALCGTSAGAMNATVTAYGLHIGGRDKARELLYEFWKKISDYSYFSLLQPSWFDKEYDFGNMDTSLGYFFFDMMSLMFSPTQFNPTDNNPLRDVLLSLIDFQKLRNCTKTKLFLCATNVKKCRAKVFHTSEVSIDAVLASACLPFLFKAVEIDGDYYWDGGYMGNPPIFPLIENCPVDDILIVQINPVHIHHLPNRADEIRDRVNELSFNSSLMHEMRMVYMMKQLLKQGIKVEGIMARDIRIHAINPENMMANFKVSSKLNTDWDFIKFLFKEGRKHADEWLDKHYDQIGVESSCNIKEMFL